MPVTTVMSQNVQYGAYAEGRWEGLAETIRKVEPQLLLLQEVDWMADPEKAQEAQEALGMRIAVAPSRTFPVAVAWDPDAFELLGVETKYSGGEMHHGYCAPRFRPLGLLKELPAPLVVISTHLTPYSAQVAAQEAQLLCARAYKYGGIAVLGGDINHVPLGDPEIDWALVQPHNRVSRCHRRTDPSEPWRGNRVVGQTLRDGALTDVAPFIAGRDEDSSPVVPTGRAGLLRVDQAHVTPALVPTLDSYRTVDPGSHHSDHIGVVFTLDLERTDTSLVREYS